VVREDAQALDRKGLKTMKNHEATETTQPAAVAEQGAPKGQQTAKGAKAKAAAPKKTAKAAKKAAKPERKSTTPRAESKGAKILDMIARAKGATLAEIMKATDWQAHSVRGFISIAAKKHSINIESSKNDAGDRVYRTK
jgi:hypothetical protein